MREMREMREMRDEDLAPHSVKWFPPKSTNHTATITITITQLINHPVQTQSIVNQSVNGQLEQHTQNEHIRLLSDVFVGDVMVLGC